MIQIGGNVAFDDLAISQVNQDVLITWKNTTLLVENTTATGFDTSDFLFV